MECSCPAQHPREWQLVGKFQPPPPSTLGSRSQAEVNPFRHTAHSQQPCVTAFTGSTLQALRLGEAQGRKAWQGLPTHHG